ncbi:MAG: ATP-binding cassette domain-containing protein [Ruminococcus sp.]|nr:ATP-binding cassette domain-containing protein [Ruminococcus sp.]
MDNILTIKDLSIQTEKPIVQNVTFTVNSGDVILLSGENGIGKSSILKSIMRLETAGKKIEGQIIHHSFGNILELNDNELQRFRSSVAYVKQKDDYSEMGKISVWDVIDTSIDSHSGKSMSSGEVNDLIDEWLPKRDNKRIFDAKSKPGKFSGGEQRLLSVFSVIATRSDADLLIIDEPLNNLDYINARSISNLINKVVRNNPQMGVIMVSHCRIFPFITRELKLTSNGISEISEPYTCHSCFGEPDENGFY